MGNYVSSALSKTSASSSSSSTAKVILPDGGVRHIHAQMKVAELMMEIPSIFLVEAKSLKIGRKFCPLAADEDIQIKGCHVYVAFPMTRATSAANASDLARLFVAAKKQYRRIGNDCQSNGRVSPNGGENDVSLISMGSKLNLEGIEEFSVGEFMHRISVSKSKKPKLETIIEESFS